MKGLEEPLGRLRPLQEADDRSDERVQQARAAALHRAEPARPGATLDWAGWCG